MNFRLPRHPIQLFQYLPRFLLIGRWTHWEKRLLHLQSDAAESPYRAKVIYDYHWLELTISRLANLFARHHARAPSSQLDVYEHDALMFAGMMVEVYQRLSKVGKINLEGRIADASQARNGFASLYHEMSIARSLLEEGCDIQFPDMENAARFDIQFTKRTLTGEIECKGISADAGRKIHRHDFYSFVESIGPQLLQRCEDGRSEIVLIKLAGRLSLNSAVHMNLKSAISSLFCRADVKEVRGDGFVVRHEDFPSALKDIPFGTNTFYSLCCSLFGANCHVSGPVSDEGRVLVVMVSELDDDHSKPILDALRQAAGQLSAKNPGFVAVQYNEIDPADLESRSLRRSAALLSITLFQHYAASHVAAVRFSAYGRFERSTKGTGERAFAVLNKNCLLRSPDLPLLRGSFDSLSLEELIKNERSIVATPS